MRIRKPTVCPMERTLLPPRFGGLSSAAGSLSAAAACPVMLRPVLIRRLRPDGDVQVEGQF